MNTIKPSVEMEWLRKNRKFLSINQIEKTLEMPEYSLTSYLKNQRPLAEKWHPLVNKWVRNLIKLS